VVRYARLKERSIKMRKIFLFIVLGIILFSLAWIFLSTTGLFVIELGPEEQKGVIKGAGYEDGVTYTTSTDTICSGGICTKTLYSGIRNVYENDTWKRVENATSLKDKEGFYLNISLDPSFNITIGDYNYTTFKNVCISSNITGNIPLTIYRYNGTGLFSGENETPINEIDVMILNPIPNQVRCFNFTMQRSIFAYTIKWGNESTLLNLQDADTENLEDGVIYSVATTTEYGAATSIGLVQTGGSYSMGFVKFNISSILNGQEIVNATFSGYITSNGLDAGEEFYVTPHYVYQDPNFQVGGGPWIEGTGEDAGDSCTGQELCWAERPTPSEHNTTVGGDNLTYDSSTTTGWSQFNVTAIAIESYGNGNDNLTIWFKVNGSASEIFDRLTWASKEHATTSWRPMLNITYQAGDSCSCPSINTNWEIDFSDSCLVYSDCDIGTGNITWTGTGTITFNSTIEAYKMDPPPSGGLLEIGPQCLLKIG
jgi:hypothetical protein